MKSEPVEERKHSLVNTHLTQLTKNGINPSNGQAQEELEEPDDFDEEEEEEEDENGDD